MAENPYANSEAGAIKAMEGFIAALNAGDNQALFNTMHVPHIRISETGVAIHNTQEDLERDYLNGFFSRAGDVWHHTKLDFIEVLHSSVAKVHLYIQWTRYDKDDVSLLTHQALWIMRYLDGRWGAQCRSSFAP